MRGPVSQRSSEEGDTYSYLRTPGKASRKCSICAGSESTDGEKGIAGGKAGAGRKCRAEMERSSGQPEGGRGKGLFGGFHLQGSDSQPRLHLSLSSLLLTGKPWNGSWDVCGGRGSVGKDPIALFSVQFRHFGFQSCWDPQWP